MNMPAFAANGTGTRTQPPGARHPRGPGRYIGTTWRPADLSAKQLRWVLQALLLVAAFLLLMSFYTVVRGAVARGPVVLAVPPVGESVTPADPALQHPRAPAPENAVLPPSATPRRASFEPR